MALTLLKIETSGPYCEIKYPIERDQLPMTQAWLSHYGLATPQFSESTNITVYYDTQSFHSLWENLDGATLSQKLRMRLYGTFENQYHYGLEWKNNIGAKVLKHRIRMKSDSFLLNTGPHSLLAALPDKAQNHIIQHLEHPLGDYSPRIQIEYRRKRLVIPSMECRANLDQNICATWFSPNSFSKIERTEYLPYSVLEFKAEQKPDIPSAIKSCLVKREAVSKYSQLLLRYSENLQEEAIY